MHSTTYFTYFTLLICIQQRSWPRNHLDPRPVVCLVVYTMYRIIKYTLERRWLRCAVFTAGNNGIYYLLHTHTQHSSKEIRVSLLAKVAGHSWFWGSVLLCLWRKALYLGRNQGDYYYTCLPPQPTSTRQIRAACLRLKWWGICVKWPPVTGNARGDVGGVRRLEISRAAFLKPKWVVLLYSLRAHINLNLWPPTKANA